MKNNKSKRKQQWKKVEIKRMLNIQDQPPNTMFRLPSGFQDREIRVYEDTEGNLDVWYVYKD